MSPADLMTMVVVGTMLVAATMAAAYVPARRATEIDPALALNGN